MSANTQTIESLRETLTKVVKKDFSETAIDEVLNLDSINRISLIVELEWVFDIEIDSDGLDPEVFETINSLASFIAGLVDESV